MDHSSADESDVSDSDIGVYEKKTYNQLKAGKLKVKHGESTFRCPFCLGKKKQDYNSKDLLQHASGVGAASKRKAKVKATHLALARYLKVDVASLLESPLQLATVENKPTENDEKYVWPWMGILVNLPAELKGRGFVGESEERLRARFSRFRPLQVTLLWDTKDQVDYAIMKFAKNWIGLKDALAFEKHFNVENWNKTNCRRDDLYGWVARTDDYNSLGPTGKYLRKNGELKAVRDLEHEGEQKKGKRIDYYAHQIEEKNKHLEKLKFMNNQNAMKLDRMMEDKDQLVEEHNQNIIKLQQDSRKSSWRIINENLRLSKELQIKKDEIDRRCKELDYLATKTNIDRVKLMAEKEKNVKDNDLLNLANLKQKKADDMLLRLVEKHKKETEDALRKQVELEKELDSRQKLELEIEQLRGRLEVMKQMGYEEDVTLKSELDELREKLENKDDDMESMESLNQTLIIKERRTNDELKEAKKELIIGLQQMAGVRSIIGVKRMGELDQKAFHNVCKKKMPQDELELAFLISQWEHELRKPEWHPFKVIETDGKTKEIIKEDDEKLQALRVQYGDEAYNIVVKALLELNEYNPSGRYPEPELWNFRENRKAPIPEVAKYLVKQWKINKKRNT
ncbi:factor of DNA methylation 4-like [Oryza brachyantha]|uniref:Factor of DNA methylation 1-5/IDN2 domain-containing protein n=1 Tax=Oryza brachyantha TaxID=4533 RepID=J3LQL2_ORYBR|nr:factor of DNA methylation 4-like [Oryza brachyantha]